MIKTVTYHFVNWREGTFGSVSEKNARLMAKNDHYTVTKITTTKEKLQ